MKTMTLFDEKGKGYFTTNAVKTVSFINGTLSVTIVEDGKVETLTFNSESLEDRYIIFA